MKIEGLLSTKEENNLKMKSRNQPVLKTILYVFVLCFTLIGSMKTVYASTKHTTITLNGSWGTQNMAADEEFLSFDFTIPSAGKLEITTQTFRKSTYFKLYNDDQTISYFRQQFNGGSEDTPETQTMIIWLQAGIYHYIAADNMAMSFAGPGNIRTKMAFTPANNTEDEPNDKFETAMNLEKGRIVKGALLKIDDRYDFYKITPQAGTNNVNIRLTSYAEAFLYTIYNSSFVKVKSGRAPGSEEAPGVQDITIEAPEGSLYYIKISDDYFGEDHTFGIYTLQWTQNCEHTFGTAVVTKAADFSEEGVLTYTCTKCGEEKLAVIPSIASVELSKTSYTYNGKAVKPAVIVTDRTGSNIVSTYYNISYSSGRKNAGTYKVNVTMKDRYSGTKTLSFKINKASQKITNVPSVKKYKYTVIKKKAKSFTLKAKAKTALSYRSGSKYIKVTGKGKVTVKKKTPKGTYTITIKAKATKNYKAAAKKIKITVK